MPVYEGRSPLVKRWRGAEAPDPGCVSTGRPFTAEGTRLAPAVPPAWSLELGSDSPQELSDGFGRSSGSRYSETATTLSPIRVNVAIATTSTGPLVWPEPTGAALGPRTTGKPWTTAANDGQPTVLVSSRFQAFAQVKQ